MSEAKRVKVGRDDYSHTDDNGVKIFNCPECGNETALGICSCGVHVSWSIGRGMHSRGELQSGGLGYYGHDGKIVYY